MKFRNLIFVLAIAFSAIFLTMIGTSYAYYVATGGTTVNVTTGNIGVAVFFEQSQYINVNTAIPITDEQVDTLANKSIFSFKPDLEVLKDSDVAVNISIVDLSVSEALKTVDFKYKLVCNDGTKDIYLINADGTSFNSDVMSNGYISLGSLSTTSTDSNKVLDLNKTYTCTLSIWLHENGEDQNALMNKKFSGLIRVNTLFKTKEDVVYG